MLIVGGEQKGARTISAHLQVDFSFYKISDVFFKKNTGVLTISAHLQVDFFPHPS
jgi:hypothetical protein